MDTVLRQGFGTVTDPRLGPVDIHVKTRARRFIARWDNGRVSLTVPPGCSASDVSNALQRLAPKLLKSHNPLVYTADSLLQFDDFDVSIRRQTISPYKVTVNLKDGHGSLGVGEALDFGDAGTTDMISRGLKLVASWVAPGILIPRARQLASDLGCTPMDFEISRGTHILGQCNRIGRIKLSSANMFLTRELRDYIICHELAHLSEMNHSARFHALCNAYCGGHEKRLVALLNAFHWPILR